MKNTVQTQQQQQDDLENSVVTWEHQPAPTLHWHVTGVVTPMDIWAHVLDQLPKCQ